MHVKPVKKLTHILSAASARMHASPQMTDDTYDLIIGWFRVVNDEQDYAHESTLFGINDDWPGLLEL